MTNPSGSSCIGINSPLQAHLVLEKSHAVFSNPAMSLKAGSFRACGFLSFRGEYIASRRRRGGGNVGIAAHELQFPMRLRSDSQGLWEGRKTRTIVFRAFHKPPFPRPLPQRHASYADFLICSNIVFLACCMRRAASVSLMEAATRFSAAMESPGRRNCCGRSSESSFSSGVCHSL